MLITIEKKGDLRMFVLRISMLIGILAFAALNSGCVVIREYAPQKENVKASPQEYELARKLLQAFIKNDVLVRFEYSTTLVTSIFTLNP